MPNTEPLCSELASFAKSILKPLFPKGNICLI